MELSAIKNDVLSLLETPLFDPITPSHRMEDLETVYLRAQAISRAYAFTEEDILSLTDKFWDFHLGNFMPRESSSFILIAIQYNLAGGTIAKAAQKDERYRPLLKKILNFDVSAQFLLTEADHGLDVKNLETTAVLQGDGSFILNTPTPGAAKFMPPSMPIAGLPRVAVVFAKLIVRDEDRGIRPFLVALGDGTQMCKGVTSKLAPPLSGTCPLDHALTSFDNVRLASSALLGSLNKPKNLQENFFAAIHRVGIGTLSLILCTVPLLKACAYIYGRYSMRRTVFNGDGKEIPIISFRTQQLPVLRTLAQATVMEKMARWTIERFRSPTVDPRVRHGLGAITKGIFIQHSQQNMGHLIDRCGAQGLFVHNQLSGLQIFIRWNSIAEGDILALSIRLVTELLLGRYEMPKPMDPTCLLAKHEAGLIAEARAQLFKFKGGHRSEEYNSYLLPRCRTILEAIGHRMAYEAGREAGLPADILSMYEVSTVEADLSWYVENQLMTRDRLSQMENAAVNSLLPRLETLLEETEMGPYCTAPMVSREKADAFSQSMPSFSGNGEYDLGIETGVNMGGGYGQLARL